MRRRVFQLVMLALFGVSCADDTSSVESVGIDSTGTSFRLRCDDWWCTMSLATGEDCGTGAELAGERFLVACTGTDDVIFAQNCRPLACDDDDDCTPSVEPGYTCREEVCEAKSLRADYEPDRVEVYALCLRDVPRNEFCKHEPFAEPKDPADVPISELVADNCDAEGSRCSAVPETCMP